MYIYAYNINYIYTYIMYILLCLCKYVHKCIIINFVMYKNYRYVYQFE